MTALVRSRPVVAVVGALLLLAACTKGPIEPATEWENLGVDDSPPLVDTASILFPLHPRYEAAYKGQLTSFYSHVTTVPTFTAVTDSAAEVYLGPGSTYDMVTYLGPGETLQIDGEVSSWYRIADAGGYISMTHVKDAYPDGIAWTTTVVGTGSHAEVDACLGGLIDFSAISEDLGRPYLAMHSYCGGEPLLSLAVGDHILIDDIEFAVINVNTELLFGDSAMVKDIPGDVLVHTCNLVTDEARVIGLERVER